ncbi:hypothetical protein [Methylobacterium phyllostachyos]|uniref:hypothetical protein n=1 Tax=Methylobacterium phyllostachyos TaxID=582672 RepID=UPI00115FD3B4|nr:hypothetical protein [Methylobacterium phyllostachyos]
MHAPVPLSGPEGRTPADAAIAWAVRACGRAAGFDAPDTFAGTPPGDVPVVFGPFLNRSALAVSLADLRRFVPAAIVVRAQPPKP